MVISMKYILKESFKIKDSFSTNWKLGNFIYLTNEDITLIFLVLYTYFCQGIDCKYHLQNAFNWMS